jgi:hypothetical protein
MSLPEERIGGQCPHFEGLEQRLLLTTVAGGQVFVYLNSQGEAVRVSISGAGDSMELFANESRFGGIVDMPGVLYTSSVNAQGQTQWAGTEITWPDGSPIVTRAGNGNIDGWVSFVEATGGAPMVRGAAAEIFCLFVSSATASSVIALSVMNGGGPGGNLNDIDPWGSTLLPVLSYNPNALAPAGSGGVLVGASWVGDDPLPQFMASPTVAPTVVNPMQGSRFPGGNMYPGIMIDPQLHELVSQVNIGADVQAVAVNDMLAHAVDIRRFEASTLNNGPSGVLGTQVGALAGQNGLFYTADSAMGIRIAAASTPSIGTDIVAIAGSGGVFYAVDETTHHLIRFDSTGAGRSDRGLMVYALQAQLQVRNVTAMTIDALSGELWVVGTAFDTDASRPPDAPDPAGPRLFLVNPANARVTEGPAIADTGEVTAIGINAAGALFVVNASAAQIYRIDRGDGSVAAGPVDIMFNGDPLAGIVSAQAIGTALYVLTQDGGIYSVNTGTGAAELVLTTGLTGANTLAYDPALPGYFWTVLAQGTANRLASITAGATWVQADSQGAASRLAVMTSAAASTTVYTDLTALAFNGADLWGVAMARPLASGGALSRVLVRIDPATGEVLSQQALAADLRTLAFDAGGVCYGVTALNELATVNTATGAVTPIAVFGNAGDLFGLAAPGQVYGIEFIGDALYAIDSGALGGYVYAVDPATADVVRLGSAGASAAGAGPWVNLGALAYDPSVSMTLWSVVNSGGFRLAKVNLSSSMATFDRTAETVSFQGLSDAGNPQWALVDVTALDYSAAGQLIGIGSLAPIDYAQTPAPVGLFILTIDPLTGVVTSRVALDPLITSVSSLAFDASDNLYVVAQDNLLVRASLATGLLAGVQGVFNDATTWQFLPAVVGIDFIGDKLYAATADELYVVDPATGASVKVTDVDAGRLGGLASDPLDPTRLWAGALMDGRSYFVTLAADPLTAGMDVGTVRVGGTVAGSVRNMGGSLGTVHLGFLWGDISARDNIATVVLKEGGGAMPAGGLLLGPDSSLIYAGGTITRIYVPGAGTMYTDALAGNNEAVATPTVLGELEYFTNNYNAAWLAGYMVDWNNNSLATAQWVSNATGAFTLSGMVNPDAGDPDDWFSMSLMANQTFVLGGRLWGCVVEFYNSAGDFLDSYGYETVEDVGVGSRGLTIKPMRFTAPAAGVYYMRVTRAAQVTGIGYYELQLAGATAAALGGVTVASNLTYSTLTAANAGNFGAGIVSGATTSSAVYTLGGGNIIAFESGAIAASYFLSDGNIGRLAALTGSLEAFAEAGSSSGMFNPNAFIQNVWALDGIIGGISSTGSIGVIHCGGTFRSDVLANTDGIGPGAKVDMIDVGGNWGDPMLGTPVLRHGPGGDFGYIRVAGDIIIYDGQWFGPLTPHQFAGEIINDDGGGRLTISLPGVGVLDANGNQIFVNGMPLTVKSTAVYRMVPVDDSMGGVGGVLVDFIVTGSAVFSGTGVSSIGELVVLAPVSPLGQTAAPTVTMRGTGVVEVYYIEALSGAGGVLDHAAVSQTSSLSALINSTRGGLVSGTIAGVGAVSIGGSIGPQTGSTGAWLPGRLVAPQVADMELEPQYGWFAGTINGLEVLGDITSLAVGGSLHDLRVTGTAGTIVVNSDSIVPSGQWHGVSGIVWTGVRLGTIAVGDGLADDGGGWLAQAAIMSSGSIGTVSIVGPRREVDGRVFGELNGSILGMQNAVVLGPVNPSTGLPTQTLVDAVGAVKATGGASITAIIAGARLDWYQAMKDTTFVRTGGVGTVSVSGAGAFIDGSEIAGLYVRSVSASAETLGLFNSFISGDHPLANLPVVGLVEAGGAGMANVSISGTGGNLGIIRGLGLVADIRSCLIVSTGGLSQLSGRDIFNTGIHLPGAIGVLSATRDMILNRVDPFTDAGSLVGAINTLTVGRDFLSNDVYLAGLLGRMTVGGEFGDSTLVLQGPTVANLNYLSVGGSIDAGSSVISAGHIGSVIVGGVIAGSITAMSDGMVTGFNSDVDLIQVGRGYTGQLSVAGTLKRFISLVALGSSPTGQFFEVGRDLLYLRVDGDLFSSFNVGGNVGTVQTAGTFYGTLDVHGNVDSLLLGGSLGGMIGGVAYGNVIVFGCIKTLKFNSSSDLVANLDVGGSLASLTVTGGSILGNITSRYGCIGGVTVTGGNIAGSLRAESFGPILVSAGSLLGNVTTTAGPIKSLRVINGSITGDITVNRGAIDLLEITNGSAAAGRTIFASDGIGTLRINNGSLNSSVRTGGNVGGIFVSGGNVSGGVNVDGDIGSLTVGGAITGLVRAGGRIGGINAGGITGALISAGWDIATVKTGGFVRDSQLLAGFDVGADGAIGSADDVLHSGSFSLVQVGGQLDGSVFAAGVGAGPDGDFRLADDNTKAPGVSFIVKMTAGGFANSAQSFLLADTWIDSAFAASATAAGVTVRTYNDAPLADTGAINFGASPFARTAVSGGLRLTLNGPGTANFNAATGAVVLHGTTSASSLMVTGVGTVASVRADEDASIGSITFGAGTTVGDIRIDGSVRILSVQDVLGGAAWVLSGGVVSGRVNDISGGLLSITGGSMGVWTFARTYELGVFTADSFTSISVSGGMGGHISAIRGTLGRVAISQGMWGSLTSQNAVSAITVGGGTPGQITVNNGNLTTFRSTAGVSGSLLVARGWLGTFTVLNGSLGGDADTMVRTARGIGSMSLARGAITGLVSTLGDINSVLLGGAMAGRLWAGGNFGTMTASSMNGATLAAGGNINIVRLRGNMEGSFVLAGFGSGDGGLSLVTGETGNIGVDRWVAPLNAAQVDVAEGGCIQQVWIGGDMIASAIAAGVSPGADGFIGTADDVVGGVGTVGVVRVSRGIYGSGAGGSYGVFASAGSPQVFAWNRPFVGNGNANVGSLADTGGSLKIVEFTQGNNWASIRFNRSLQSSTLAAGTSFIVTGSMDQDFATPGDNIDITTRGTLTYDDSTCTATFRLNVGGWSTLTPNIRFTVTDAVTDKRNLRLDGEYAGLLPTGDGTPGGTFVYRLFSGDWANTFASARTALAMPLVAGAATTVITASFNSPSDVDVIRFMGTAGDFFAARYNGNSLAQMGLFVLDDQGTASTLDDVFEMVIAPQSKRRSSDVLFEAVELPRTGEYYLVVNWDATGSAYYSLGLTLAASDAELVNLLGGSLPAGEQIAYVSNALGAKNTLGFNAPKQLVYVNYKGGTAVAFRRDVGGNLPVAALNLTPLDAAMQGSEDALFQGAAGVTGVMQRLVGIYAAPATGSLNANLIDLDSPADVAAYLAATDGIWFTTDNPALLGLSPLTDFTTVFVGQGDNLAFGPRTLAMSSIVDVANLSKADEVVVFAQEYTAVSFAAALNDKLNDYASAFANDIAHELGHVLGLPHTWAYMQPDNGVWPSGNNVMAEGGLLSYPYDWTSSAWKLGTSSLYSFVGSVDTSSSLGLWLR